MQRAKEIFPPAILGTRAIKFFSVGVFRIVTRLRAGRSGTRILVGERFSPSPVRSDMSGSPPNPLFSRYPEVKLTTHLQPVPRLRMSGAIIQLTLYAFMLWTRTALLVNNGEYSKRDFRL